MRRVLTAAALLLAGPVLAGCNGDDTGVPEFTPPTGTPTSSPSASATTAAPGATAGALGDTVPKRGTSLGPEGNPIKVGMMVKAASDAERAVQLAYLRFWVERARALRVAKVDEQALAKVATGDAAERVRSSVHDLAAEKQHAEGGSTVNVRSVKIDGRQAKLVDCFQDFSVAVSAKGKRQGSPDLGVLVYEVTLTGGDGGWLVSEVARDPKASCPDPKG